MRAASVGVIEYVASDSRFLQFGVVEREHPMVMRTVDISRIDCVDYREIRYIRDYLDSDCTSR